MDPTIWLSAQQFEAFRDSPVEGPIVFVNLLAFRAKAAYPPGTEDPEMTGRQAYDRYRPVARQAVASVGGRALWYGHIAQTLVGPTDASWDEAALAEYPSRQAFIDMIQKPEYRAVLVHREAALARSHVFVAKTQFRNLET